MKTFALSPFRPFALFSLLLFSFSPLKPLAQENVRDKFLVDKIETVEEPPAFNVAEFVYNADNKLIKIISTSYFYEQYHWRDGKYVQIFEYENNFVSKMMYYDSTHFMFDYETRFKYNSQGQLIRSEQWKDGMMYVHKNYHYENGLVVCIYPDSGVPFNTIFYDNAKNVIKYIAGPENIYYFEYDNELKPNVGLDDLFAYGQPPLQGAFPVEIGALSNNNMTKFIFNNIETIYNYTYNEYGLPKTCQRIWNDIPTTPVTITYKPIEVGISEPPNIADVQVYPNPTTGQLTMNNEQLTITDVEVLDVFGRKQKAEGRRQKAEGKILLNISGLAAGVYFVKIRTDAGEVVRKVIKN
jgi:hypothetical protein